MHEINLRPLRTSEARNVFRRTSMHKASRKRYLTRDLLRGLCVPTGKIERATLAFRLPSARLAFRWAGAVLYFSPALEASSASAKAGKPHPSRERRQIADAEGLRGIIQRDGAKRALRSNFRSTKTN